MNNKSPNSELFEVFFRTRHPALRNQLIIEYLGLVRSIARQFINSGEPIEDLIQEGIIGLVKAVDRFDPNRGVHFITYATHCIRGAILNYLRDLGKLIHEPSWHRELRYRILGVIGEIEAQGRTATTQEIASRLGLAESKVNQLIAGGLVFELDSLDEPSGEYPDGEQTTIGDSVAVDNRWAEQQDTIMTVRDAIDQLSQREKRVVILFFYYELTKTEIARQLGISINYVCYLLRRGLELLREILTDPPRK